MKKRYYSVAINYVPYMCDPITYFVVISETPEKFLKRNTPKRGDATHWGSRVYLLSIDEISNETYEWKKKNNPIDGYLTFKQEDYNG